MRNFKWFIVALVAWIGIVSCGTQGLIEAAKQCVRDSDGTDTHVENCYYDRGLELPE